MIDGWNHLRSGKVRDLYTNESGHLLIVASDRISAFDYILPTLIPGKGKLLTQLSLFWFEMFADLVPNHLISTDVPAIVKDRAVIVKPLEMFPIECVARGYLAGSGWVEYQKAQSVTEIPLPAGLLDGSKLPQNIFTPATKAEMGDHDENISFARASAIIGEADGQALRALTLQLYSTAHDYAATRGIILADTKFEFGVIDGSFTLVDEILTPDSSRFWPMNQYEIGVSPPSLDKQYVRDYLESLNWDKKPPAPKLPREVVLNTSDKYLAIYKILTGSNLE